MIRRLIAVISCAKYRDRADVQRRTWMSEAASLGIDVRVFVGGGVAERDDEIVLDVPDDYPNVRRKVQLAFQWSVMNGYDRTLKTDDDCVVFPDNWEKNDPLIYDYVGRKRGPSGTYVDPNPKGITRSLATGFKIYGVNESSFCSGFGYTLSRRAACIVPAAPDNGDWAEDRFVGNALAVSKVHGTNSPFYLLWPLIYPCGSCRNYNGAYSCPTCQTFRRSAVVVCPYAMPESVERIYRVRQTDGIIPVGM